MASQGVYNAQLDLCQRCSSYCAKIMTKATTKVNAKANEMRPIAATDKGKIFSNEEIKDTLFNLVTDFDAVSGQYVIAGTAEPVEDSILNRVSFVNAVDQLIDAIKDGYEYGIINSLSVITSKKYATDLGLCVQHLERSIPNNFIKDIPLSEVIFKDEIINIYWKSISLNMKKVAVLLLVAIGHMTDRYFEIPCSNYGGDTCNFYGCLDQNKCSFFDGRIPGTKRDDADDNE